jgi:hypothetical protein
MVTGEASSLDNVPFALAWKTDLVKILALATASSATCNSFSYAIFDVPSENERDTESMPSTEVRLVVAWWMWERTVDKRPRARGDASMEAKKRTRRDKRNLELEMLGIASLMNQLAASALSHRTLWEAFMKSEVGAWQRTVLSSHI